MELLHEISEVSPELHLLFQDVPDRTKEMKADLIAQLSREEKNKYVIRDFAKVELKPITTLLNVLRDETNIPEVEYERLRNEYKTISRAVGMLTGGKIDHTR